MDFTEVDRAKLICHETMKTMRWWVCLLRLWCGSRAEEGSSELAVQYHLAGQGWVEDTLYFGADCDVDRLAASWAKWHVDEVAECGSVGCAAQTTRRASSMVHACTFVAT